MRYVVEVEKKIDGRTFIVDTLRDRRMNVIDYGRTEVEFIIDILNKDIIEWENMEAKLNAPQLDNSPEALMAHMIAAQLLMATEIAELKKNQELMIKAVGKLIDLREQDKEFTLNLNGLSSSMFTKKDPAFDLQDLLKHYKNNIR